MESFAIRTRRFAIALPALAVLSVTTTLAAPQAWANVLPGPSGQYAVFGLGSTMSVGNADSLLNNTAEVYGSTAVGADTTSLNADGNGSFQKGFITGNLYVDGPTTPASYTIVNKNFTIGGTVFGTTPANPGPNPDSTGTGTFDLSPAVQDAINESIFYGALPGT